MDALELLADAAATQALERIAVTAENTDLSGSALDTLAAVAAKAADVPGSGMDALAAAAAAAEPAKAKIEIPSDADAHITSRAFIRYEAGSAVWRAKQYEVQAAARARSEDYKRKLQENWAAKKDEYNRQRREQRL